MRVEAIAARFAALPEVLAVAWAGSQVADVADFRSDLDIYVYARGELSPEARRNIAAALAAGRIEIDNRFWEPGDEWIDAESGLGVDVMFRSPAWIEDQLERVLARHEASVGYSTCFWYNVLNSRPVHDPQGWYAALQRRADQPYPEPLAAAIIARNHPILRDTQSSYRHQIELAIRRRDRVSLNHRITALLASYFDVLFAINRLPHPGEKRLVDIALRDCPHLPEGFSWQVDALIRAAAADWDRQRTLDHLGALVDGLDGLLGKEQAL